MAACSNTSQLMTSLIPIYAAMIAALHVAVGADVGAFLIETLATSLYTAIEKERANIQLTNNNNIKQNSNIIPSNNATNMNNSNKNNVDNKYITSKSANNCLLLMVYLYNLRVLHHTLIVDIMTLLAGSFQNMPLIGSDGNKITDNNKTMSASSSGSNSGNGSNSTSSSSSSSASLVAIGELEIELLVCLINHCGAQLRADDPLSLKTAITTLNKRAALQSSDTGSGSVSGTGSGIGSGTGGGSGAGSGSNGVRSSLGAGTGSGVGAGSGVGMGSGSGSSRLKFMLEALTDLRNNKSRRIQSANADIVKDLRHWLGSVKNSLGGGRAGADLCLRVSLKDLLDAENKGRWWKAGASWAGKDGNGKIKKGGIITGEDDEEDEQERAQERENARLKKSSGNQEEEKLLILAHKMRFNTATRRNIFVVIMSSRDIDDAFERLQRLELKGKQDREVVRVISECCAQEKSYNAFYSELAARLCSHNRQYKTSIQFIFWDNFKLFDDEVASRRIVNLARLLASLVTGFHLPLAVLKPIDMTDLNANMMLFLATFFMAIFSAKVSHSY